MTLQFSTPIRNQWLNDIETLIGPSAQLHVRTGAPPANCATANTGTLLVSITLPVDWMNDAVAGVVTKLGVWQDTSIDDTGTPGHFRIYDSTGAICGMQGTATVTGGGGDMEISVVPVVGGLEFTVTACTLTAGSG